MGHRKKSQPRSSSKPAIRQTTDISWIIPVLLLLGSFWVMFRFDFASPTLGAAYDFTSRPVRIAPWEGRPLFIPRVAKAIVFQDGQTVIIMPKVEGGG